jgi:Bifunctional DNA primase/polymerase, N-terminal
MPAERTLIAAALALERLGFSLLGVGTDKKPVGGWKRWQAERMSTLELQTLLSSSQVTGVGIVCGAISGIMVLDVDEGGLVALEHIQALVPHGTPQARTGSGGQHFYFKFEFGQRVSVWHWQGKRAGELRGEGGYVVAPPSLHPSGNRYEWLVEPTADLPPMPRALRELVAPAFKEPRSAMLVERSGTGIPSAALVRRAVNRSLARGRNNAGFDLACHLRDNGYGMDEAGSAMLEYARAVAGSGNHGYTQTEALRSLEQAFSRASRPTAQPVRKPRQFQKRRGALGRVRGEKR